MPSSPSNIFKLVFEKTKSGKPKIVVSKKVASLAVDRNRIRRVVKEAIRSLGTKNVPTIIVKVNIADKKMPEVASILKQYLK